MVSYTLAFNDSIKIVSKLHHQFYLSHFVIVGSNFLDKPVMWAVAWFVFKAECIHD
jgi:hypothetical protein